MLFPTDAKNNPQYLEMFRHQIITQKMLYLIKNKVKHFPGQEKRLSPQEADEWIESLKSRSVFQVTKGNRCVVSPHFAGDMVDRGLLITDLVSYIPQQEVHLKTPQDNIHWAGISMLYGPRGFPWVKVPIHTEPLDIPGIVVEQTMDGLVFKRSSRD